MSQALDLYRLQKIDTRRDQINNRLAEIDKILSQDLELLAAQQDYDNASQELQAVHKKLKSCEDAVQTQQIKIEQTNASLYGGKIHNPKELQDLQNDLTSLKRYLQTLEDQQLEVMITLEMHEAQLAAQLEKLHAVQAQSIAKNSTLVGEQTSLHKELGRFDTERQAVIASIPQDMIKLYDRLRQVKRGLAVTSAKDASCDACGASLTASDWQIARQPNQISFCPSCGRILYAG